MTKSYTLYVENFQSSDGVCDLESDGDTLEELLERAVYHWHDTYGGYLSNAPTEEPEAQRYIVQWYQQIQKSRWFPGLVKRGEL